MATLAEAVDILSDNFETALSALIEHHGADALTSLAAVMRHYNIKIDSNGCGAVREGAEATHHLFIWEGDEVLEHKWCKKKKTLLKSQQTTLNRRNKEDGYKNEFRST